MKSIVVFAVLVVLAPEIVSATDFKHAKFTQVINDVKVISGNQVSSAEVNGVFQMPDTLRTGPSSRAELVAPDDTITRVGANTIFTFDPADRTIDLQQGSLLFHSPHGKGGGTIRTASAVASVLGTTLIVSTTPNGGLKVLDLEGSVEVRFLNGLKQHLQPGEMTFILPGGKERAPIIVFRLDQETKSSALVNGFATPLASMPLINQQILSQLRLIRNGLLMDTRLLVGSEASANQVQILVDPNDVQFASDLPNRLQNNNSSPTPPLTGEALALTEDATISSSLLSDVTPNHVFFDDYEITDNPFLETVNPYDGFFANNITIDTPTIDLSSYTGEPWVDIVAAGSINIENSVTFTGFSSSDLYLDAGASLTIAPGATVEADCNQVWFGADAPITLDDVSLINNDGDLDLDSFGEISLTSGSSVSASGLVEIGGGLGGSVDAPNVDIDSSTINAGSLDVKAVYTATLHDAGLTTSSGDIDISTEDNSMDLEQSTLASSGNIDISSGGALTMGTYLNDTLSAGGSGGAAIDAVGDIVDYSTPVTETGGGDIDFNSSAGTLDIENGNLTTSGDVNITSSGTLDLGYYNGGGYADQQTFTGDDVNIQSTGDAVNIWATTIDASDDINITSDGTITLAVESGDSANSLTADNDISLASSSGDVDVFDNTTLTATYGDVNLTATAGAVDLENSTINAANVDGANVTLSGPNGVTVSGSTINTDPNNGTVNLTATGSSGMITVNNGASIQTGVLTLNADGGILLDGSSSALHLTGGSSAAINLTTQGTLTLNTVDLSAYGSPVLAAHTVDLDNVTFGAGSSPTLKSFLGLPNFGSAVPGDVNFLGTERYGTQAIVASGAGAGQVNLASTPITITTSGF